VFGLSVSDFFFELAPKCVQGSFDVASPCRRRLGIPGFFLEIYFYALGLLIVEVGLHQPGVDRLLPEVHHAGFLDLVDTVLQDCRIVASLTDHDGAIDVGSPAKCLEQLFDRWLRFFSWLHSYLFLFGIQPKAYTLSWKFKIIHGPGAVPKSAAICKGYRFLVG
jgi:hypothetical protein